MFGENMLHDGIVSVRIDAEVRVTGKTEIENGGKDMVCLWETCNAVDDMIGQSVVQPFTLIDCAVGGVGRGEEGKIADNTSSVEDDEAAVTLHVGQEHLL